MTKFKIKRFYMDIGIFFERPKYYPLIQEGFFYDGIPGQIFILMVIGHFVWDSKSTIHSSKSFFYDKILEYI